MNDDELLRRLAEAAREEERAERDRLDPRWGELAAGRLSGEDEAALRRQAEESMEARQALEAFTPLGADFRARMVREAREQLGAARAAADAEAAGRPATASPAADAELAAGPGGEARVPGSRRPTERAPAEGTPAETTRAEAAVRPFHLPERKRRSASRWVAAAALAAALAAVVLWPEAGPLPAYQAVLEGAVRTERGPGDAGEAAAAWPEATPFAPGNRFELLLRPETAVERKIDVGTFRQDGGSLLPWPLPRETAGGGAVRIAGTVGREIRLPAGESTLVVVLGRRGELPTAAEVLAELGESGRAGAEDWQAWRWLLELAPAAEP
jgi:hypothetical protein